AASLRAGLASFDPGSLGGAECARVAEELALTEKACAAARLLAGARAVECGAHQDGGFGDGATWLARQGGTTTSQARQALGTAAALKDCPDTRAALLKGEVSLAQAGEITRAESETPGAEADLLDVARHANLSELRDRAREQRHARTDVEDLHRQQHRARRFRHWRDRLGMVCFTGALAPEAGVPLVHRLELAAQRARRAARGGGADVESFEAYAADALVATVRGGEPSAGGGSRSDRADLVIVCDLFAWRRGHAHHGEPCHIVDGGPIPVRLAKELAQDAFVKAVLHDGVAIHTVKHFGRYLPVELRTALDLGPVPRFTGARCADCGRRFGLEYDHVDPLANHGPTAYANLEARCWADHQAKTMRDRRSGLLGPDPPDGRGPASRSWVGRRGSSSPSWASPAGGTARAASRPARSSSDLPPAVRPRRPGPRARPPVSGSRPRGGAP
ncbi:MAG: HNH endonuclease, partial [Acidimicrobiales bacterium]